MMTIRTTYKRLVGNSLNIIISSVLLAFSIYINSNTQFLDEWYDIIPFVIVLFVYHIVFFLYNRVRYNDFRLWFIILSYVFMFGIVFLYYFGLTDKIYWDVLWKFSEEELTITGAYCLCSIQMIFTGFFLVNDKCVEIKGYTIDMKALHNAAIAMLVISTPCRFIEDGINALSAQAAGSYNAVSVGTGLIDDFATMFVPAILLYCVSVDDYKLSKIIIYAATIYHGLTMVLTGDRRNAIIAIIVLFLFYNEYFKSKRTKPRVYKVILYSVGAILVLNALALLKRTRLNSLLFFVDFFKEYLNSILTVGWLDTIYESLGEFGLSFFSVANVISAIPSEYPFQYGMTIVKSIIAIIPIGWMAGDFFENITMSTLINKMTDLPVGASLIGDMYSNFGFLGAVFSAVIGFLLYKSMLFLEYDDANFQKGMYFTAFYIYLNLVRATIGEVIRPIVWILFVLLVIFRIRKRRNTIERYNK